MASRTRAYRGFATLPLELLREIISYSQHTPIPWVYEFTVDHDYRERQDLLRALCQLCHSVRALLLPTFWETLEVCVPSAGPLHYEKIGAALAKELLCLLKLITEKKLPYSSYVRVVNVALEYETAGVSLNKLAHAMTLMPNLHSVQILCHGSRMKHRLVLIGSEQFQNAFRGLRYASVRRAILPIQAKDILACFPQVIDVFMNQPYVEGFEEFTRGLARDCSAVESLGWVETKWASRASAATQMLPHLRSVHYYLTDCGLACQAEITELSKLRNLDQITLVIPDYFSQDDSKLEQLVEAAKRVLAGSSQRNKRLDLIYENEDYIKTIYV